MPTTLRLLSTYNGNRPNSIITVDDATAAKLLSGGVNATTNLSGGVYPDRSPATPAAIPVRAENDSSGRVVALLDSDGSKRPLAEIGAPGADVLASKKFPHLQNLTRKALNLTATPTFSATPTAATEVYVDFNRGNDANPGTRLLPKKNLSALSLQTYGAGSMIALASDSVWELIGTLAGTSGIVNAQNWKGTDGNPVLVTAYDPAGHTGLKPTLSHRYRAVAADWVWDAPMNAWVWTPPANLWPDAGLVVFFGPARLQGTNAYHDPNGRPTLPPLFGDMQYGHKTDYTALKKVWVWAPSTINPTDYYGEVYISFPARGPITTISNGLTNVVIDGLRFVDTAHGVTVSVPAAAGANVHTNLVIRNCETEKAGLLNWFSAENAANTGLVVHNNKGANCPSAFVRLGAQAGTLVHDIYANEVRGANRQISSMAAFYIQTKSPNLGDAKMHHNYVSDAWHGVGTEFNGQNGANTGYGASADGTAYYLELGSDKQVMFSNVSERCNVAFQTNSCKMAQVVGHIAIDCNVLCTITDAFLGGSNDVTVAHCTYINRLPDLNQLKRGPGVSPKFGILNFYENSTASTIRVFNNAFHRAVPVTDLEALRIDGSAATRFCAGNAVSGWTQDIKVRARSANGSINTDITATAVNVYTSGAEWFEANLPVPSATSPLVKAGVRHMDGLKDASGVTFDRIPTIGALEYTPM